MDTNNDPTTATAALTFEQCYTLYYDLIYHRCLAWTRQREQAEDLAQDTFVHAYHAWARFEPVNVRGWLLRIARNLFLSAVRPHKHVAIYPLTDDHIATLESTSDISQQCEDRETLTAIQHLPCQYAFALLLRMYGYSYREIGARTGYSAMNLLARAHHAFREQQQKAASLPQTCNHVREAAV